MPKKKGPRRQTTNEQENAEQMFSLYENVGAELAERMNRQDGIGLDEMEEMAESGDVGPEGRDILMEERELRRKVNFSRFSMFI